MRLFSSASQLILSQSGDLCVEPANRVTTVDTPFTHEMVIFVQYDKSNEVVVEEFLPYSTVGTLQPVGVRRLRV